MYLHIIVNERERINLETLDSLYYTLCIFLQGLTITDLEDLLEDIKVYLELEQGKNTEYWRDIVTVTTDELTKLRKQESNSKGMSNCVLEIWFDFFFFSLMFSLYGDGKLIRRLVRRQKVNENRSHTLEVCQK